VWPWACLQFELENSCGWDPVGVAYPQGLLGIKIWEDFKHRIWWVHVGLSDEHEDLAGLDLVLQVCYVERRPKLDVHFCTAVNGVSNNRPFMSYAGGYYSK
jgi:hypothetical protein